MSEKKIISTDRAPAAIGAYSQAVVAGDTVYVSGQIPFTPEGELVSEDVAEQTEQSLENLRAILAEAGAELSDVVKVTVFAADMDNFSRINDIYADYFQEEPPARAFVEVSRLPRDVEVEIEAVAVL